MCCFLERVSLFSSRACLGKTIVSDFLLELEKGSFSHRGGFHWSRAASAHRSVQQSRPNRREDEDDDRTIDAMTMMIVTIWSSLVFGGRRAGHNTVWTTCFFSHFLVKNDAAAKTGSRQTQGNAWKRERLGSLKPHRMALHCLVLKVARPRLKGERAARRIGRADRTAGCRVFRRHCRCCRAASAPIMAQRNGGTGRSAHLSHGSCC